MIGCGIKLGRDYAIDLTFLYCSRCITDGLTALELQVNFDWFKGDHNPQFQISLTVLNMTLVDVRIYNVHHLSADQANA